VTRKVLVIVLALTLIGCAVEGDGQFSPIARSEIPFGLADAATTTAPTTTTTTIVVTDDDNTVMEEVVDLYYLLGSRLFRVQTTVVSPATPDQVLTFLHSNSLSGPSYVGLRSALPTTFEATITVNRGVAEVDAGGSFLRSIAPSDQRLAVAQLVATLTSRPGIGQVVFAVDGEQIAVPRGRGDVVPAGTPVTFEDYAMLIIGG
jgi:spore germination protein GerM